MEFTKKCPECGSKNCCKYIKYETKSNGYRYLLRCKKCENIFSQTQKTFMFNVKTPISKIALTLNSRTEGMSFNAACKIYHISPHTLQDWEAKFSGIKETLLLYSLSHNFVSMIIEGDELYTKVNKKVPPQESEGWTISLMDRASRFIWELSCGIKEKELFLLAMEQLSAIIEQTDDVTLLTDGERRYGSILLEICYELLTKGQHNEPEKVLPKGVKVRIKNKGNLSKKKKK